MTCFAFAECSINFKRVEMIMNRTRMTSTVNSNMTKGESYSSLEVRFESVALNGLRVGLLK